MIAEVVPVLRLRRATTWWSYKVPPSLAVQPGSLVEIPFRGRLILGVVWTVRSDDTQATESVTKVLTAEPLLRQPHRQCVEWLSEAGVISLSTALFVWLPAALRKYPLTKPVRSLLDAYSASPPEGGFPRQKLILLPSERSDSITRLLRQYGGQVSNLFRNLGDTDELVEWLAIARGERSLILGRERALAAPVANLEEIQVIEPEDISYYREQAPYLNMVEAAAACATAWRAAISHRSQLPEAAAKLLWGAKARGSAPHASVTWTDLRVEPVLNETLIRSVQQALRDGTQVLLLYNAHDKQVDDTEKGLKKLLPGVETLRKQLAQQLGLPAVPPSVILDTRKMFQHSYANVGLTAVLSLDPLLSYPLFSDQLHGCADLGRLLAFSVPCHLQTRQFDHPLVQALRAGRFSTYLEEAIKRREQLILPPYATTYACSRPLGASPEELQALYAKLETVAGEKWKVSFPVQVRTRGKEVHSLLLYAPAGTRLPAPLYKVLATLQRPWKIQRNPWHLL